MHNHYFQCSEMRSTPSLCLSAVSQQVPYSGASLSIFSPFFFLYEGFTKQDAHGIFQWQQLPVFSGAPSPAIIQVYIQTMVEERLPGDRAAQLLPKWAFTA